MTAKAYKKTNESLSEGSEDGEEVVDKRSISEVESEGLSI